MPIVPARPVHAARSGRTTRSGPVRQDRSLRGGRGDDAAGDAIACIPGGIGLHIVRLLVDDDGGAAVRDDAVGRGRVEREIVHLQRGLTDVALTDGDVLGKIAGMVAHGILNAVLFVLGIEVGASGLEIGRIAQGFGMDVDSVLAYRKIFEVELDGELALFLLEGGGTGVFTGAGLEGNDDFVLRSGEDWSGEQTKRKYDD